MHITTARAGEHSVSQSSSSYSHSRANRSSHSSSLGWRLLGEFGGGGGGGGRDGGEGGRGQEKKNGPRQSRSGRVSNYGPKVVACNFCRGAYCVSYNMSNDYTDILHT